LFFDAAPEENSPAIYDDFNGRNGNAAFCGELSGTFGLLEA
jgi:hypothetical protein